MRSTSLLFRLIVLYVVSFSLIAITLLYAVPELQKSSFLDEVMAGLEAISQAVSDSVENAIRNEDFSSLNTINQLLESHPNVSFAAIYVVEDSLSEIFSIYPNHLADDPTFTIDSDQYLVVDHPITTEILRGHVVVGYDISLFESKTLQLNKPVYIAFALVLFVQIWSYRMISRSVVQPILKAATAADSLRGDELSVSLLLEQRPDEIGLLNDSLKNLQSSLLRQQNQNEELTASLEERVRERTTDLQKALAARDNFLSSVSHELRTPLHSIIASLDLQMQKVGADKIVENGLIAAQSLLSLINDLLDYQKLAYRGVQLSPTATGMSQFFKRIESLVTPLFKSDSVHLRTKYTQCDDLWVSVDSQRLEQIIVNLLGNACKFTREGEVVLRVQAEVSGSRARCTFVVSDTGIGMDKDTISRLGNPFFQGTEGYNRSFGGTGLGLGIVNNLLELMDSRMNIQSALGEGSTFSFVLDLPVEEMVNAEVNDASIALDDESIALDFPERLRMLYVEDVQVNQFFMVAMAKQLNVELTLASSALEGYEYIKNEPFDVVLSDIQMPEHDGTELIRWVRENPEIPPDLLIYAFTAHAEHDRIKHFLAIGFNDVLTKPLGLEHLRVALGKVRRK